MPSPLQAQGRAAPTAFYVPYLRQAASPDVSPVSLDLAILSVQQELTGFLSGKAWMPFPP
jgi:hypothetical protein